MKHGARGANKGVSKGGPARTGKDRTRVGMGEEGLSEVGARARKDRAKGSSTRRVHYAPGSH